ncbi:MAG TPA: carboxypeptidase-like regulatory domain-containing protein, partial [Vicinamibacterales bacterium]
MATSQTNTGAIAGVVKDATGAVLAGAVVIALQPETGASIERVTDSQGRFYLPALQVGVWDLTIMLQGFTPRTQRGLVLELGSTLSLEFTLVVQGLSEQIVVDASPSLLQRTTAEISDVIDNRQVMELPLNGRALLALAQLSDAVVIPPGGTRGDALQQAGPLPNVGGQRSGHNIYLLDGVKITDELFNNLAINPAVDSVQEFKLQKSMYPAEFGGKASALINVASKSGTNQLHGSGFEFFRDEALDSRNYFQPVNEDVPPLRQNQFGMTLGTPIVRDRTFAFASFERSRMQRSLTRTFSVPSAVVRAGDFSGLGTICDPETTRSTGTCASFADNKIPAARIDPIAAAFLQHVPLPTSNTAVQNLVSSESQERNIDQFTIRLDHRLRTADQLFGRFSTFDADETQPFGTSVLQEALVPGFGRTLGTTTRNVAASYTQVFGGSVVHELRAGWMRVSGGQASVNRGDPFAMQVGLLGVTADPRDRGFPQISTSGAYSAMGDPASFTTRSNTHVELYDNVTVDRGAHRLKFGAFFYHLALRPEQPDNARGTFVYTGQFSGSPFADFLLGYPTSASVGIGRGDEDGRTTWMHVYAQDDWRARRNLTLNLGLRYELNQHMYDVNNRLSSVDLSVPGGRFIVASDARGNLDPSAAALLPAIPLPVVSSADAGWGRGLLEPSHVRLAPRTGFALSLGDRAVIRGGYGVFLNQWAYSVQTAFARNLPFFFAKQVDVPNDVRVPTLRTADMLVGGNAGTIG